MPRVNARRRPEQAQEEDLQGGQGIFRWTEEPVSHRKGRGGEGVGARIPGPEEEEEEFPARSGSPGSMPLPGRTTFPIPGS